MNSFLSYCELRGLIELARQEDLGGDDITSRLMIGEDASGLGTLVQKEAGIVAGLPIVEMVCRVYDQRLRVEPIPGSPLETIEGRFSDAKCTPLLRIRGPLRSLLSAERVILNFLQHLSGIATLTNRYIRCVAGTGARILDTRKTLPGFRLLDKYAVRAGGGLNHRMGLYDGLLVKDNHLAHIAIHDLSLYLSGMIHKARAEKPDLFIEVEVDNLDQLAHVIKVDGIDVVLLDNMDCAHMQQAVALRDKAGKNGKPQLEASGGVSLATVRAIAESGVERISVGAITHSAAALDIGLEIE